MGWSLKTMFARKGASPGLAIKDPPRAMPMVAAGRAPSWRWAALAALAAIAAEAGGLHVPALQAWLVSAHEFFHALAGWLTGGSVASIQASSMQGVTFTSGGWYPVISCAGYVGTGALGAACLRYCSKEPMRWAFMGFCVALGLALVVKGSFSGGYAGGMAEAIVVDVAIIALAWVGKGRAAPFLMAMCGCLFLALGYDDVRVLLVYSTSQTDAGLLARHLGLPFLAWPIALAYALGMTASWIWAIRGLAIDARAGSKSARG